MSPILVVVNSTGLQGVSVVRSASEEGFQVRAQVRSSSKPEAQTLAALPNVTLFEGNLDDPAFVEKLFKDADFAWVNTTFFQKNESEVGKSLALAAKNAGVKHYLYSSLGDHTEITNGKWKVPVFAAKYEVEKYIRSLENFPATFVYVGGYMQNFNGTMAVKMTRQEDGSILWKSKYPSDAKVPYLDTERDLGPVIVRIIKDGPEKWHHKRVAVAFETLTCEEIAKIFSEATGNKIVFEHDKEELDPKNWMDGIFAVGRVEVYFNFDCKVPEDAKALNPNWHSMADFAKNKWKNPVA